MGIEIARLLLLLGEFLGLIDSVQELLWAGTTGKDAFLFLFYDYFSLNQVWVDFDWTDWWKGEELKSKLQQWQQQHIEKSDNETGKVTWKNWINKGESYKRN